MKRTSFREPTGGRLFRDPFPVDYDNLMSRPSISNLSTGESGINAPGEGGGTTADDPGAAADLAARLGDRTIVLVGLMGAGKSSIGRRLAPRLDRQFIDADSEIEAVVGCTISEFFARHGEAAFRDGERKVIARLLDRPPRVLATGGGAFMEPETRARIAEKGISVWLRANLDTLLERVSRRTTRPLLRDGNPRRILADLMAARYPVYALADITVDSHNEPHEAMVARLLAALADFVAP